LQRAGGFRPDAYPYGAILQRVQVREIQENTQAELIRRVQAEEGELKLIPEIDPDQKRAKEAALQQLRTTLDDLSNSPPAGRLVIQISSKIQHWQNTRADIEVRAGDKLIIPKRSEFVNVNGQVYNPTAVTWRGGKSAEWYLSQAGGPTNLANKRGVFVIRADGSVLGGSGGFLWTGSGLKSALLPGDTVVVPERAYAGGHGWQNVLQLAQIMSAVTSTLYFATIGL